MECDHCGACCRVLIVEAGWVDAVREPRLLEIGNGTTLEMLRDGDRCVMLYDSKTRACPFLITNGDCLCSIHPTR